MPHSPLNRIVAYGNPQKAGLGVVLPELAQWSQRRGIRLSVSDEIAPALDADGAVDHSLIDIYAEDDPGARPFTIGQNALLVSLGGDGTLIRAVRRFWSLPSAILSVNLGYLGFNASVQPEQVIGALEDYELGRATISDRMALKVQWLREGQRIAESIAVNDAVLIKQNEARMIHVILCQNEAPILSMAADGLIVATPTGSTAYNLSAGGPIVYPTMKALVATAICPHTLAARPVVLPPSPPVVLEFVPRSERDKALIWIDGQERWELGQGDQISIEAAAEPMRLISCSPAQYFATLRSKLAWSTEPPSVEPELKG